MASAGQAHSREGRSGAVHWHFQSREFGFLGEQLAGQTLYSHSVVYPTLVNRGQASICASGSSSRMTQFHVWWGKGHSYISMQCMALQLFPGEQGCWYSGTPSSSLRLK